MRIIGIDPGLNHTGWGCIDSIDNRLIYVGCGRISPSAKLSFSERLNGLYEGLMAVMEQYQPQHAAVEETFMNNNAASALKLGMARGVACLVPARMDLAVGEYAANKVKKAIVGSGHADKGQMQAMVKVLLPKAQVTSEDAADALAVAICHAHHGIIGKETQQCLHA